jgi:hypothetical protein
MPDCVSLVWYRTCSGIVSFFQSGTILTGCWTVWHSGLSIYMYMDIDMDMQHGHGHALWTSTCSMGMCTSCLACFHTFLYKYMLPCYENIISFQFYFQDNFLRPHLSFFDPFTATLRPLTATNLPWPNLIFYGYISGKWPSPRPSGNPAGMPATPGSRGSGRHTGRRTTPL